MAGYYVDCGDGTTCRWYPFSRKVRGKPRRTWPRILTKRPQRRRQGATIRWRSPGDRARGRHSKRPQEMVRPTLKVRQRNVFFFPLSSEQVRSEKWKAYQTLSGWMRLTLTLWGTGKVTLIMRSHAVSPLLVSRPGAILAQDSRDRVGRVQSEYDRQAASASHASHGGLHRRIMR